MYLVYDEKDLINDTASLAGKDRITEEVAKELAEFKQAIDYAAHIWYDLNAADEVNVPEDIHNAFDTAHQLLEEAYCQVVEFFPQG